MRKRLLTVLGACMALVVALALPTLAATIGYNNIAVSYFPDGAFEVNNNKVAIPVYFMSFRSSGVVLNHYYPTVTAEAYPSDLDLVFEYRVSLPHPNPSPETFDLDLFVAGDLAFWSQFPNVYFTLTWRTTDISFVHEDLEPGEWYRGSYADGTPVDYTVPTPTTDLPVLFSRITASGLRYPSSNNQHLVLTVHNALYDMSFNGSTVQSVDDLFSVLDDFSLAPAMSVLDDFFGLPFVNYCMCGLGVVIVFCFVVRLF